MGDSEVSLSQRSSVHSYEEEEEEEEEREPRMTLFPQSEKHAETSEAAGRAGSESGSSSARNTPAVLPVLAGRPSLGLETSVASVDQSLESTLEFHDAPAPEDLLPDMPEPALRWEEQVDEEVIVVRKPAAAASAAASLDGTLPQEPPVAAQAESVPQMEEEEEMLQEEVEEPKPETEEVMAEPSVEMDVSVVPPQEHPGVEENQREPEVTLALEEEEDGEAVVASEMPEAPAGSCPPAMLLNETVEVNSAEVMEPVTVSVSVADDLEPVLLVESNHQLDPLMEPQPEPEPTIQSNHAGEAEEPEPKGEVEENVAKKQDVTGKNRPLLDKLSTAVTYGQRALWPPPY